MGYKGICRAASLSLGSAACVASGQSFLVYSVDGVNLTDPGRGTDNAQAGDVIRASLRVHHDGLSYAGGKVELTLDGIDPEDITLTEDAFAFPFDPWEIGRTPITRMVASDGPADATRPHNEDVVAIDDNGTTRITDVNGDFFDFASTPPGLGGLAGAFPTADGDAIFVFDYVYDGRDDCLCAVPADTGRLWADAQDINGTVVDARGAVCFGCIPSPGPLGVLLLAGLGRARRE